MWRCASIKPGMTVLPPALMARPTVAVGAVAETEAILPARTTIAPRSITRPVPSRMRALVIVRSCACVTDAVRSATAAAINVRCDRTCIFVPPKRPQVYRSTRVSRNPLCNDGQLLYSFSRPSDHPPLHPHQHRTKSRYTQNYKSAEDDDRSGRRRDPQGSCNHEYRGTNR